MPFTYEIRGALSVLDNFRHSHARQFAESIANPADVYFATDAVTHSLMLRIRGVLCDEEMESVEDTLEQFSQKWAQTGAIFRRVRHGEASFVPVGLARYVELLEELADEHLQLEAFLQRQTYILEKFRPLGN
ncbi:hypothetical protein WS90_19615 [Burkholderia cepacia]|uniref:Uncharacterized protein n=1 Tax=Burkholderia cepacia TaxID=292 RepID=A0A103ZFC0_BURCE|nr:hypothetical protein [Burkholderia cepacia]KVK79175.1 hypothetical protein WS90_19615 [Burkholderia cepacia]